MVKEILYYSYWEHFKAAKDLALILGSEHPRVKKMLVEANKIQEQIKHLNA